MNISRLSFLLVTLALLSWSSLSLAQPNRQRTRCPRAIVDLKSNEILPSSETRCYRRKKHASDAGFVLRSSSTGETTAGRWTGKLYENVSEENSPVPTINVDLLVTVIDLDRRLPKRITVSGTIGEYDQWINWEMPFSYSEPIDLFAQRFSDDFFEVSGSISKNCDGESQNVRQELQLQLIDENQARVTFQELDSCGAEPVLRKWGGYLERDTSVVEE